MEDFGAEGDVVDAAEDIEVEDPPLPSNLSFETLPKTSEDAQI